MCTESVSAGSHISHYSNLYAVFAKLLPTISWCGLEHVNSATGHKNKWDQSMQLIWSDSTLKSHWLHASWAKSAYTQVVRCIQRYTSWIAIVLLSRRVCLFVGMFVGCAAVCYGRSLKLWEGAQVFASFSRINISLTQHPQCLQQLCSVHVAVSLVSVTESEHPNTTLKMKRLRRINHCWFN